MQARRGEAGLEVTVEVANTSERDSRRTVQVSLEPAEAGRPIRLIGYRGVDVPAGATAVVPVVCDDRLLRRWDEAAGAWTLLTGGRLVLARGLGDVRARVSYA